MKSEKTDECTYMGIYPFVEFVLTATEIKIVLPARNNHEPVRSLQNHPGDVLYQEM